jgi:hypothetical protein
MSNHEQISRYLQALAKADPARTHLFEYAKSWEGRRLFVLAIGNPERIARLESIKTELRHFADPRILSDTEAETLLETLPVVTWLLHSSHGDELSPSDAALAEAYHLLAAKGNPGVDSILQHSIVLIDPLQNPDGRERFIF